MHSVSIMTLDGFNEIDSFVALNILNRADNVSARLVSHCKSVTSMNGVSVTTEDTLAGIGNSDAVVIGSGVRSGDYANDPTFMSSLALDPSKQLIGSQCSGALILASANLLPNGPVSTDKVSEPRLIKLGFEVADRSFCRAGNVATAGGCLSAVYLSAWILNELCGASTAVKALYRAAPVGEAELFVRSAMEKIEYGR